MARRKRPARPASAVVAERIRQLRKEKRWTQTDLAEAVTGFGHPMHQTAIAKIEAKQRKVSVEDLLVLALALDVPPPLLFLPFDRDEDLALTPTTATYPWRVWEWLHGEEPLPSRNTPEWHRGSEPALLYANVRDDQKQVNRARLAIRTAEYEGDQEAISRAKRRYVEALTALDEALEAMERKGWPTDRLVGEELASEFDRLGIRSEGEKQ